MSMSAEERVQFLRNLQDRSFDEIRFRAADAVVISVPDDVETPPAAVMEQHAARRPMRIYPAEGSHIVKWMFTGGALPEGCSLEAAGWDHEHCDACNRHINAGHTFWQTTSGPCVWLCSDCYRETSETLPRV
ncbi:MAG: hypothetical protein ACRC8S_02735 [Fimbriiglobus sp.]